MATTGDGAEDVESLPEFRGDTANPGWRNIADRLGVRPLRLIFLRSRPTGVKVDHQLEA